MFLFCFLKIPLKYINILYNIYKIYLLIFLIYFNLIFKIDIYEFIIH